MKNNANLALFTLGGLRVECDGAPVGDWASRKAEALLVYLALTRRAHERESLATLLWDDRPTQRALGNLSVLLSSLRKNIGDFLVASRQTVGLDWDRTIWVDAHAFADQISEALPNQRSDQPPSRTLISRLEKACALYHGDFLAGFHIREAGDFEEWALFEQERLQYLMVEALHTLGAGYLVRGGYQAGITHLQHLLKLDPLRESAHRSLMRALALDRQRNAALKQYQVCRDILHEELGVEPHVDTTRLYQQIKRNEPLETIGIAANPPAHKIPADFSTFVGREAELRRVKERLNNPTCHLLTLIGPGGVGKTRLAREAATRKAGEYLDGVWFVSLAALDSPDYLPATMADAIGLVLAGIAEPRVQLLNYLAPKEMLLVLDNFEHLIEGGVELLVEIMRQAPDVQLLVTSRERLNLRIEWMLTIEGLGYPADEQSANAQQYSAVRLFAERAHQAKPYYHLTPSELACVVKICRLVEGMPLAIEMATSLLHIYPCTQIAARIEANLSALETSARDVPARHRSVRAVFDHSWHLLTPAEQALYRQLAVFRNGFTAEAAAQVTGSTHVQLASLVDKSLLKREGEDRYVRHVLLQQYAAEKLAQNPSEEQAAQARHGQFFGALLAEFEQPVQSEGQSWAVAKIQTELDNVRQAWKWAVAERDVGVMAQSLESMLFFYDIRCLFQEGLAFARDAHQALTVAGETGKMSSETSAIVGRLLSMEGWFRFRLAMYDEAKRLIEEGLRILAKTDDHRGIGNALVFMGAAHYGLSEFETAKGRMEEAIVAYQQAGYDWGIASALGNAAEIATHLGDYEAARRHADRAYTMAIDLDNPMLIAHNAERLGDILIHYGELEDARRHFEHALGISRTLKHAYTEAVAEAALGEIALTEGDYQAARSHFEACVVIARAIESRIDLANALVYLGRLSLIQRSESEALDYLEQGLQLAVEIDAKAVAMSALVEMAAITAARGQADLAIRWLAFVQAFTSTSAETKTRAEETLAALTNGLDPDKTEAAVQQGRGMPFDEVVAQALESITQDAGRFEV